MRLLVKVSGVSHCSGWFLYLNPLLLYFLHILLHLTSTTSTVMAAPPPPPNRPPQPPPLPPNPSSRQMMQHLLARVDHIDRRLGQLFQVYHAVNKKLNAVLDANDVEYDPTDDDVSDLSDDPSLPSDNDGED